MIEHNFDAGPVSINYVAEGREDGRPAQPGQRGRQRGGRREGAGRADHWARAAYTLGRAVCPGAPALEWCALTLALPGPCRAREPCSQRERGRGRGRDADVGGVGATTGPAL